MNSMSGNATGIIFVAFGLPGIAILRRSARHLWRSAHYLRCSARHLWRSASKIKNFQQIIRPPSLAAGAI